MRLPDLEFIYEACAGALGERLSPKGGLSRSNADGSGRAIS
jgi:hypothetical protein